MYSQINISNYKALNFGGGPGKLPEEVIFKLLHFLIRPIVLFISLNKTLNRY